MTLTEQWKKSELEAGWYYVLLFSNEEYITFIDGNWVVDDRLVGADIKEVLAPVPSYEEWQELSKQRNQLIRDVKDLAYIKEGNQQLNKRLLDMMDLLQKCYFYLNAVAGGKVKTEHLEQIKTLAVLIDNVIGEKK